MASIQLPAYNELGTQPSQLEEDAKRYKVNRKPVLSPESSYASNSQNGRPMENKSIDREFAPRLPTRPRPDLSVETSASTTSDQTPLYSSPARTNTASSTASGYGLSSADSFPTTLSATTTGSIESTSSQSSASSQWKKAYEEARHFAGGLIQRPIESTKHFTILRHSHGLAFYQGSNTTLAISVFSDEPLPSDRCYWLQSKGWTGKAGMRAKSLMGRNAKWLDVTPTVAVRAEQLNPTDERAWQRDFRNFQKKAPSKIRGRHQLRETAIVRIPAEAGDGYFQIVLCTPDKKKIFCCSPDFRVLSTSVSPSSVKGASLGTLPFELGAMVLATYGKGTVGNTVSAVASPFQGQVSQYMPSFWTRKAASAAYEISGVPGRIDTRAGDAQAHYETSREELFAIEEERELSLAEGPKAPYPINFVAARESATIHSNQSNLPIIPLSVPQNIVLKLHGYYFAWARQLPKQNKGKDKLLSGTTPWVQAIFSAKLTDISQLARVNVAEANRKRFTLNLIEESEDEPSTDLSQFEIRVMGFLRPDEPAQQMRLKDGLQAGEEAAAEALMLAEINDVSMAQGVLDHPSWAPDATARESAQEDKVGRLDKLRNGYADTRIAAQRHIDKVSFQKIGVRAPGDAMRDRAVVMNGFYVVR